MLSCGQQESKVLHPMLSQCPYSGVGSGGSDGGINQAAVWVLLALAVDGVVKVVGKVPDPDAIKALLA